MKFPSATTLFGLLLLPAAALVSGLTQQWLSPRVISADPGEGLRADILAAGFGVVEISDLRNWLAEGQHLILDARDLKDYAAGHLPGAQALPLRDFESHFPEVLPLLASGMPVVIYCSGPACDDALELALRLRETGFDGANIYAGGWQDWRGE